MTTHLKYTKYHKGMGGNKTGRQTERERDTCRHRQTERMTDRDIRGETDKQIDSQTQTCRHKQTDRHSV